MSARASIAHAARQSKEEFCASCAETGSLLGLPPRPAVAGLEESLLTLPGSAAT